MSELNGTATVSKASAIREVLGKKGGLDLTANEVAEKVKEKYGIEVSGPSVYQERRKFTGDKPAEATAPKAKAAPVADEPVDLGAGLLLVKELAGKVGGVDALEKLLATYKAVIG